jgi:GDP-L-fucose synthase
MRPDTRIFVAGHNGLAGSALVRALRSRGYSNFVLRTHAELDLLDEHAVASFFQAEKPQVVFLAAARVGGILANQTFPADFIQDNLTIQTNVIHEAWRAGIDRLLFLGSSCIYPRDCPQPIREDYLLTGPLEPTNRPYALAKIAGVEMCWAYNRQHGTQYLCAMPTNLYGPRDNYELQSCHVLPALIRRFHDAKQRGDESIVLWGTGRPRREFLYSDDMAAACVHLMELPPERLATLFNEREAPLVNVGCGEDLEIRELAALVRDIVGARVDIEWDATKPDGTPRKLLDVGRLLALGWRYSIRLPDGIRRAYADFLARS